LAYEKGEEKICVFEDDVHTDLINSKCNFTLGDVCNLKDDWECIQLFYISNTQYEQHMKLMYENYKNNGIQLFTRTPGLSGTCYIINRKGMKNILNNVVDVSENFTCFKFKKHIRDPEDLIFNYIKTYYINRQLFYYYFQTMTFDSYIDNNNMKKEAQLIHLNTKNILTNLYT